MDAPAGQISGAARGRQVIRRAGTRRAMLAMAACAGLLGCESYSGNTRSLELARQGEYGRARAGVEAQMKDGDSEIVLDRMKLLILALADGTVQAAEPAAESLYETLRTQGVNEGRSLGSFVVGEQAGRLYKGDPFEQAMSFHYMGLVDGLKGDWGNVRATANNSLFAVKDFSHVLGGGATTGGASRGRRAAHDDGEDPAISDKLRLARASQEAEQGGASPGDDGLYLSVGERPSDFELGYVMKAIASRQLSNSGEVDEVQRQLDAVAPRLRDFMKFVAQGSYNTVLVLDFGVGPQKVATGPDGVIAAYRPRTRSSAEQASVRVGLEPAQAFPVITDINRLAQDVAWNNLEDVRRAKSVIGDVLIVGGATAVAVGSSGDHKHNEAAQIAGLAAILAGAALKSTASADTRHCELMPQRVYVAPVQLPDTPSTVEVSVGAERMVLPGLAAPRRRGDVQLRYVRFPESPAAWATSGRVLYSNDATGEAEGPGGAAGTSNFPYILGGRCVRTPSEDVLASYRRSGYLQDVPLEELIDLYREEGIDVQGMGMPGDFGRHVLEGGNSLYTPSSGSSGFLRLMCGEHPAYQPRSSRVAELARRLRVQSEAR